jgi:hypothetical protein
VIRCTLSIEETKTLARLILGEIQAQFRSVTADAGLGSESLVFVYQGETLTQFLRCVLTVLEEHGGAARGDFQGVHFDTGGDDREETQVEWSKCELGMTVGCMTDRVTIRPASWGAVGIDLSRFLAEVLAARTIYGGQRPKR